MISVVIPTYGRPQLLAATLDSLRRQTHTDVEVLVCDNGADPATRAVVEATDDPRFVYVPRAHNLGIQGNTLAGFTQAKGEFVFKIDDDDLLPPHTLAQLHAALVKHPEAALAFGTLIDVRLPRRTRLAPPPSAPPSANRTATGVIELTRRAPRHLLAGRVFQGFTDLVALGHIHLGACLVRAEALAALEVNPASATAFDLDILFKLSNLTAVHVPEATVYYRRHRSADSFMAPVPQSLGAIAVLDDVTRSGRHRMTPAMRDVYARVGANAVRGLLREGRFREAHEMIDRLPGRQTDRTLRRLALLGRMPALAWIAVNATHVRYRVSLTLRGRRVAA